LILTGAIHSIPAGVILVLVLAMEAIPIIALMAGILTMADSTTATIATILVDTMAGFMEDTMAATMEDTTGAGHITTMESTLLLMEEEKDPVLCRRDGMGTLLQEECHEEIHILQQVRVPLLTGEILQVLR